MPKTILVTGGSGQLGRSIRALVKNDSNFQYLFPGREQLDLSNSASIDAFFKANTVDLIINCAAHTAVDKAESEPKLADQINHLAVKKLAKIASEHQAKLQAGCIPNLAITSLKQCSKWVNNVTN